MSDFEVELPVIASTQHMMMRIGYIKPTNLKNERNILGAVCNANVD